MMRKTVILALALIGMAISGELVAQEKYGHLNLGNLVAQMPETEAANEQIKKMQADLLAERDTMLAKFRDELNKFSRAARAGNLSPVKQAEQEKALQEQNAEIEAFQQGIGQKLEAKRLELMEPILNKVEEAVQKVAKAKGYVMIFDTSIFNALLFVDEGNDVMELVKEALGI